MKKLTDYKIMHLFPSSPVADPQISPNGTKVLFTYSMVDMAGNKYRTHIWLQPLDERRPRQFTHGAGSESYPRWSPNGREILFLTNREGDDKKGEGKRSGPQGKWQTPWRDRA